MAWADAFRQDSSGSFQLNLWVPDPPPARDGAAEEKLRRFLASWSPKISLEDGDATPPDFESQCAALLAAKPRAVSSIMGLFPADYVKSLKAGGIAWFATATTLSEALRAEEAGPTRLSRKASRLAAIAAPSILPLQSARASGFLS